MTQTKPPIVIESQTWKSYEETILKWLRMTNLSPEKVVGCIVAAGLHKHAIILKLAESIADDYDYFDTFEEEDLPQGWLEEGDILNSLTAEEMSIRLLG